MLTEAIGPVLYKAVSASSSGDNTIVDAVDGKKIRVLGYVLVGAGAVNVFFQSAAAGDVISGTMAIAGAGGTITAPPSGLGYFETDKGELLNLNLSSGVAVTGHLTYQLVKG